MVVSATAHLTSTESLTARSRMPAARRRRRATREERMHFAVTEALEPRMLLSANHLVFAVQPSTTTAGAGMSAVTVYVEDDTNTIVAGDQSVISFSIATGPAAAPPLTFGTRFTNGVATVTGLSFTVAGTYSLLASDGALTPATSNAFVINPDVATHLAFTTQPGTTTAGGTMGNVVASVEDQFDNVVTTDTSNVTIAIASGPGTPGFTGTKTIAAVAGVATFGDFSITKAGAYTFSAADGALTGDTSGSFTINPDAPSQLVITQNPSSTTAGVGLGTISVNVEDQFGNVVTTDSSAVTIDVDTGSGTLAGTKTVNAESGVATFTGLSITKADDYALIVSDGDLATDDTSSFTISPDVANHLAITQQPGDATAGTLGNVKVSVEDQYNNVITTDTSSVTISVASGSASLGGTKTMAAVAGVATFTNLSITTSGTYTLGAADGVLNGATSSSFAISPDIATQVVITTGPSGTTAGQTIASIIAKIEDQYGNVVTTDTSSVTIAKASGAGALGGTLSHNAVAGVATFSGLSITTADDYTLHITDGGLTAATSGSFTISPAAASHLVITSDATDTVAGHTIASIVAKIEDQYGNVVGTDTSAVTIGVNTGTGTLLGTKTVNAVAGVATFNTLSIQRTGGFTLAFSDGSLTGAATASFTISPDAASKVVFTLPPADGHAGALNNVVVKVEDQYGNVVDTDTSDVTVAIASGGGTLLGTKVVTADEGVAGFSDLGIHTPGTFTLSAADTGLTGATSGSFVITPDQATKVVFTTQPGSGAAGALNTVVAKVEDQYNNVVDTDTSKVTLGIASGSGSLLGTATANAVNGVATFSALAIHTPDTYTLSAADSGLTGDTSGSFTISPAAASHLVITSDATDTVAGQTIADIVAKIEDQFGNVVTSDGSNVTIAITSGSGTLLGTITVAASSGVATFNDLAINTAGSKTLTFTDGNLTSAATSSFTISPDVANHLAITTGPVNTPAGQTMTGIVVKVEDQFNNVVTTDSTNVTLAIHTGSGTLNGTKIVAASNGVATFSTLSINETGAFTLRASDAGLTVADSGSFSITPALADHLVITAGPTNTVAGQTISTITVEVRDMFDNVVTTDSSNVVLALNTGTGTLSGTKTVAAANGVATFSTLSMTTAGAKTFTITDGSLTGATSGSFSITPDAASHLVITTQPTTTVAGQTMGNVVVKVEDQYGNVVTGDTSNVTVAVNGNPGLLNGTTMVAAVAGVATFSDLNITSASDFTLHVSDGGLTAANSSSFTISPDASTKVLFLNQPSSGAAGASAPFFTLVEDQYGNVVTSDTSTVTVGIATGSGTLLGTTSLQFNGGGAALFDALAIHQAGTYTLFIADGSLAGDTSSSFTVSAAAASQLIITTQPTTTVAGNTISNVVAKVEDQYGNVVTGDTSNVTIGVGTGTGALSGTKTVAAVAGVATFNTLSMTTAGSKTFTVTDGSLTSATTSSFSVTAAAANKLAITTEPSNGTVGTLGNVVVKVEDQYGNVVTTDGSSIDIDIDSGPGALLGTKTVTAVNGVATFSTLAIHEAGSITLRATDLALTDATTDFFTLTPAAPSKLVIDTQPLTDNAGNTITSVVLVEDQYDNVVTTDNSQVTVSLGSGSATINGTKTVTVSNGQATFNDLYITKSGDYTFHFADGSLSTVDSDPFTENPLGAGHLTISTGPTTTIAGHTITSIVVQVQDDYGNIATGDTSDVTISVNSGSGSLTGTTTQTAIAGIVTFAGLDITTAGSYTLTVSDSQDGVGSDISGSFSITPDAAAKVVFTTQPGSGTVGGLNTVVAKVEDQYNNVVTTNTSTVTLDIASGSGSLLGTKQMNAVAGVATFSGLAIHKADSYTLSAADGGLTGATSTGFTMSPDVASKLIITQGPTTTVAGQTISDILVEVRDQYDNLETTNASNVTIALATGTGTLSGTKTVAASGGIATLTGLSMTAAGTKTFTITDGSLTSATTGNTTISPDAATHLVITTGPASGNAGALNAVVVKVEDQYGNVVTTDSTTIDLAMASGGGTLLGAASLAATNGVATFNALAIHTPGTFTLSASDGSLTIDTSASFTITPDVASQVVFTTQPGNIGAGALGTVVAKVEDQFGNVVTTDSSTVSLNMHSGGGTLLGTTTATAASGIATFNAVTIHTAGTFTLGATDASLTAGVSNSFTVSPTAATHLSFTSQPSSMIAGNLLTGINVSIEDQYNNVVTGSSANITFNVTGGGSTFNFVIAAINGVATLNDIYLVKAGTVGVKATSGTLTQAGSNIITVTPDVASQILITTEPTTTVAGQTVSNIVVTVEDQFNNTVTTDSSSIVLAINSGPGALNGTKTLNAVAGVATFSTLSINTTGSYTLSAVDGSLTGDTSTSFSITPAAASQLVITTQPTTTVAGLTISNIIAKIEDQYGNVVTGDTSNVTIGVNTGTGSLSGTKIVAAVAGVATFSTLSMTTAGSKTFTVTDGSLTSANTSSFSITPDAASKVVFTTQPANGSAGSLNTVIAKVEDQYSNVVTTDTSAITLAVATGSGTLLGNTSVNAVAGIATFNSLGIHTADTYTLAATDGVLTADTSASFTVSPAIASQLVITTQPGSTTAGQTISNTVVKIEDTYGNVVTTDTSAVTVAIATGTGTLAGTKTINAVAGVATFSTLSINQAGAFTFSLADGSLTGATTNSLTISPDTASKLVITTGPTTTVAGQTISNIVVKVEDQFGNVVTTDSSNVTIAIASGGNTLNGTKIVAASSGEATFSTLNIQTTGSYTLGVTDGVLTTDTSGSFTITSDIATHLAITTQPASGTVGALNTVVVKVEDQYNNVVTTDTSTITLAGSGPGSLLGTKAVAAVAGVATFGSLSIHTSGAYTVSATDGSLATDTSGSFNMAVGPATQLVFTQQPGDAVAGTQLSQIKVSVEDQYGNVVTTDTSSINLTLNSGGNSVSLIVAAVNGVATFSGIGLLHTGTFTLHAIDGSLTAANSSSFTISPDVASQLVFTTAPANGAAGALSTIVVSVEDQYGNVVTMDTSTVGISLASGSGTLLGTQNAAAVNGVATFNALAMHTPGTFTLGATDGSLTAATSASYTISPAAASQLVITTQPGNTVAGVTISNIVAKVEDQYGNVVTNDSSNVTIAIATGAGSLAGTKTIAAVNGVATFSTLSINTAGNYTLNFVDGLLTGATSGSFAITAAAASQLVITTQPTTTVAGQTIGNIAATVEDQFGNIVTTDSSNVTIAIATGTGTLNGTETVAASSGVATFSTLNITKSGSFTLAVTDGSLSAATSSSFNITSDVATHLAFGTQPSDGSAGTLAAFTVTALDQYNNIATVDTSAVTITKATGPGALSGTTTVNAVAGVATFSAAGIHLVGSYTLSAADGGLTQATSNALAISAAAAAKVVFGQQPTDTVAGQNISTIVALVEDQYGNVVTTDTSDVTIALAGGPGSLGGTKTATAIGGQAFFGNLSLNIAGSHTLAITDGVLTAATSSSFTITHAAAAKLAVTQQPTTTVAGQTISTVTVAVEDQFGNVVTNDSSTVTIALATGNAVLGGNLTAVASNGVASLSTLSLTKTGAYTLSVTDSSLTGDTTSSFSITSDVANHLAITTQPADAIAGHTLSVLATVEDQFGNVVTGDTSNVTIALASGPNTPLNGTKIVPAVAGVATFSTLNITKNGAYTLAVTDGSLGGATSNSFTITADAAAKVVITQEPGTTVAGQSISTLTVAVEDQFGNLVTGDSSNVNITLTNDAVILHGSTSMAAENGIATFSNLSINKTGSYTLRVSEPGLTPDNSTSFTITPDAEATLVVNHPDTAVAGDTIAPITVTAFDQFGNIVTNLDGSVSLSGSISSLTGTTTAAYANGVATFNDLAITIAGTYSFTAADDNLSTDVTNGVTITHAAPAQVVIVTQPNDSVAGQAISDIVVDVEDQYGNIVTNDSSSVSIAISTGSGTLAGQQTVNAANGIATFTGLSITTADDYTFDITDTSLTDPTTDSITISPAAPSKLVILTQPGTQTGSALSEMTVAVEDQYGNIVTTDNSNVTVAYATINTVLGGATTQAAVNGIATFNDLSVTRNGTYWLRATDASLTSDISDPFTIGAKLVFQKQPVTTAAGVTIGSVFKVFIQDSTGHTLTSNNSTVTIALAGAGTLQGTTSVDAVNGVATFTDLAIDEADTGYQLVASDDGFTNATSVKFNIVPAAPATMQIVQDTSGTIAGVKMGAPVRIQFLDAFGNVAVNNHATVTMSINSGPNGATLGGTVQTTITNGVATFSNLILTKAGTYTLTATGAGLSMNTASFTVGVNVAKKLSFTQQPTGSIVNNNLSPTVTVAVQDAYGNLINNSTASVTLAVLTGPTGSFTPMTATAVNGIATFNGVKFTKKGTYKLKASGIKLTLGSSTAFAITLPVGHTR